MNQITLLILLAVCPSPAKDGSAAQSNASSEAARHAARASEAMQQKNFSLAEEEWREVVALDPASAQACHNLGIVTYLQKKYAEAEQVLSKALQLDPALTNARVLLGASLVRQGKNEPAILELDRALKSRLNDSSERTARLALHEALVARGEYARALEILQPLARKNPKDVDVLYNLGQIHLQLSAEAFRALAQVDPNSYRAHQVLAESLAKQGLYKDARREYRATLERKPDLPGVHYQAGLLYWLHEQTSEGLESARREFEEELKLSPYDAWTEFRLGQVHWKQRDAGAAAAHLNRALEIDASLTPARLALARLLESQGKLAEAQKQLESARLSDPDDETVRYRLAQIYQQRDNSAAAAEEMKIFQEIQSGKRGSSRALEKALREIAEPEEKDESIRPQ